MKKLLLLVVALIVSAQTYAQPCCVTQDISISQGWNTISSYILPDDADLNAIFETIFSDVIIVKNDHGQVFFPGLINQIGDWNIHEAYQVKAVNDATIRLQCTQAIPEVTSIVLSTGWNGVSYLRDSPMDAELAWASITSNVVLAKNNEGQVFVPGIFNQIGNLKPGQGYLIKMGVSDTLVYPANDPSCSDGIQNGDETDIDCGGAQCPSCASLCETELRFNENLTYGEVCDIDGNSYRTIVIGTQEWMAQNLKTSHYQDGSSIPNVTNSIEWSNLSTGGWSWINNDEAYNCYGMLYNWYAAVDARNLCPDGWHVPSYHETLILENYVGDRWTAGGELKETTLAHWDLPNFAATNNTGFTGVPGGLRNTVGAFIYFGVLSTMWTTTEFDATRARERDLYYHFAHFGSDEKDKNSGYTVRCVRD